MQQWRQPLNSRERCLRKFRTRESWGKAGAGAQQRCKPLCSPSGEEWLVEIRPSRSRSFSHGQFDFRRRDGVAKLVLKVRKTPCVVGIPLLLPRPFDVFVGGLVGPNEVEMEDKEITNGENEKNTQKADNGDDNVHPYSLDELFVVGGGLVDA